MIVISFGNVTILKDLNGRVFLFSFLFIFNKMFPFIFVLFVCGLIKCFELHILKVLCGVYSEMHLAHKSYDVVGYFGVKLLNHPMEKAS